MGKVRLDVLMTDKALAESREKAKALIMSGIVYVNGKREDKPGTQVADDSDIEVRGATQDYVSRGGYKLERALDFFGISPDGLTCIDCGASTGGFTHCLLKRGAKKVYAIDVGYGQLAWSIRNDPRVVTMERTNIRYVTPDQLADKIEFAVIDVSFISLKIVLPAVRALLAEGAELACLIKPQFEAGREKVGKKGVVRDKETHIEVLRNFVANAESAGFAVKNLTFSPIKGPEGNIEFLCHLTTEPGAVSAPVSPERVADEAHTELKDS